jgi:uncharacterized protein YdeI (YjbR/CyaY-like superfamily)
MKTLAEKLFIKPGKRWLFYNAPSNYIAALDPLPAGTEIAFAADGSFDGVQLFVTNAAELNDSMKIIVPVLKDDGVFWITYPKKSSGIKSDLEMMRSWDEVTQYGLKGVAAIAVDDTWTALRFRPEEKTKVSESCNEEIKKNQFAEYIDVENKQITLPADMKHVLVNTPAALAYYHSLSYSNQKEYVVWILSAKQEKTKTERLDKMVKKLLLQKKNPGEK